MNYDEIMQYDGIDYGLIKGGPRIVFIKVGLGGNCSGYENKYLKMAYRLQEKYGCSVIVASNPHDGKSHTRIDRQIIEQYIAKYEIDSPELFFFGHSNGGVKGLELTDAGVEFKKMILVNMPLMINFHKTKNIFPQYLKRKSLQYTESRILLFRIYLLLMKNLKI